jgi:hypothetical protein
MKKYLLPLLFLAISAQCFAQNIVSGRIINKTDKKPIANVVVFINSSAIESTTDSAGYYKLNLPVGKYQLLVTIVGFESYKTPLTVRGKTTLNDIELEPKIDQIKEVTIKARPNYSPCLPGFELEFFGNSVFARQCKILNPLVLQFFDITPTGGFSARSSDFILIENDALGYRIKFLLHYFIKDAQKQSCYFNGESFFEEMKGTPKQEREWHKNRLECYQGSSMQLLRAVISDSLAQNGFRVKRASRKSNPYFNRNGFVVDPYDIDAADIFMMSNPDDEYMQVDNTNTRFNDKLANDFLSGKQLLLGTNQKGIYAVNGKSVKDTTLNSLYIEHTKNVMTNAKGSNISVPWIWGNFVTFFTFSKKPYLVFNDQGKMLNPGAIDIDGFMLLQSRVATMLPFNYQPVE